MQTALASCPGQFIGCCSGWGGNPDSFFHCTRTGLFTWHQFFGRVFPWLRASSGQLFSFPSSTDRKCPASVTGKYSQSFPGRMDSCEEWRHRLSYLYAESLPALSYWAGCLFRFARHRERTPILWGLQTALRSYSWNGQWYLSCSRLWTGQDGCRARTFLYLWSTRTSGTSRLYAAGHVFFHRNEIRQGGWIRYPGQGRAEGE